MKKFTESLESIKKVNPLKLTYFDLFPLLDGLEVERPGIKDRIWKFLCDEEDSAWKPYNGRIMNINLFYYGVGNEYPTKYLDKYPNEVERSKKIHPNAFKDYLQKGSGDKDMIDIRLDLNLIWSVYEEYIDNIEQFPVITRW